MNFSLNDIDDIKTDNISLNEYAYVYKFIILSNYKLPFNNICHIFSILATNKELIHKLEEKYNHNFTYLKEFNKFIILSNTNNLFIDDKEGISLFEKIIKYEFPILGIKLMKCFNFDEIINLNNYYIKNSLINKNREKKYYDNILNNFLCN